jgi:hypothetical protein
MVHDVYIYAHMLAIKMGVLATSLGFIRIDEGDHRDRGFVPSSRGAAQLIANTLLIQTRAYSLRVDYM